MGGYDRRHWRDEEESRFTLSRGLNQKKSHPNTQTDVKKEESDIEMKTDALSTGIVTEELLDKDKDRYKGKQKEDNNPDKERRKLARAQIAAARKEIKRHKQKNNMSMVKDVRKRIQEIRQNGPIYNTQTGNGGDVSTYNQANTNKDFNTQPQSTTTGRKLKLGAKHGDGTDPIKEVVSTKWISGKDADGKLTWKNIADYDSVSGYQQGPFAVPADGTNELHVEFWPASAGSSAQIWDVSDDKEWKPIGSRITGKGTGEAFAEVRDIAVPAGVTKVLIQVWGTSGSGADTDTENMGFFSIEVTLKTSKTNPNGKHVKQLYIK